VLFYRAALPLSHQTLISCPGWSVSTVGRIGSVWRALNPGQQALLVLVYLRKGEPFAEVGTGFGVSTTTCWRYVNETVELLVGRAPKLRAALRKAKREGMAYVIIDGTLIPIDRIAVDRPFCSGKHKLRQPGHPGHRPGRARHVGERARGGVECRGGAAHRERARHLRTVRNGPVAGQGSVSGALYPHRVRHRTA